MNFCPSVGNGVASPDDGDIDARTSLEFGDVPESDETPRTLTVSNAGAGPLTVTDAFTNSADFVLAIDATNTPPFTLAPAESRDFEVRFTAPTGAAGTSLAAQLTVESDDPDEAAHNVALSGNVLSAQSPLETSPVLSARVQQSVFDVITAGTCSSVGGTLQFGSDSLASDTFTVSLTDQGGAFAAGSSVAATSGSGTASFSGINACGLLDGIVTVRVVVNRGGNDLPEFTGTRAVKNTSPLAAPVLDPVDAVTTQSSVQICGSSRTSTTVRATGGTRSVSVTLDGSTTGFCLAVPLRTNSLSTVVVSAVDDLATAPRPEPPRRLFKLFKSIPLRRSLHPSSRDPSRRRRSRIWSSMV